VDKRNAETNLNVKMNEANALYGRVYNSIVAEAKSTADQDVRRAEQDKINRQTAANFGAIPGYFKHSYSWAGDYFNSTPEKCRDIAFERGYKYWGFRNNLHSSPQYKNSCFFYRSGPNYSGELDNVHMVGCTYGGTPETGCGGAAQSLAESARRSYRFVRVIRRWAYGDHWLNLGEVEVYSNGTNVARNKTVTGSSQHSGHFPHAFLVDGNRSHFAHTNNGDVEWFMIDLGDVYPIDSVKIYNRTDCCQERALGLYIQLSNAYNFDSKVLSSRAVNEQERSRSTFTWNVATGAFSQPK
jgi:hypothetical protein